MGINQYNVTPPEVTEFEFSLFGRGTAYGESIVLHLGDNKWGIIDNCINPRTNTPIALEYLKALSVPYQNIEFIVCTHWHQDHITGFTSLVKKCEEADIFLSAAMNSEEHNRMIGYQAKALSVFNPAKEYVKLCNYMETSKRHPKRVIQDRILHQTKIGNRDLTLTALSPNDSTISHFEQTIRKQLEKLVATEEGLYKITKPEPNFQSVVLLLTVGDFGLLLGADLEVGTKSDIGWVGVLESKVVTTPSEIFKVPHHGSKNGYDEQIWRKLLKEQPYLALTPMKKGKNTLLPTKEMIATFCNLSSHSYITSNPHLRTVKHDTQVRKLIRKMGEKISKSNYDYGQIRFRKEFATDESEITCELFGTALKLDELK